MRDLCRVDRKLSEEDAKEVLRKASFGTLATINEDGWPYAAPMAFALEGDTLYFHSAKTGPEAGEHHPGRPGKLHGGALRPQRTRAV